MRTRVVRALLGLGLPEDAHPVRDGLGPGHGRAAVGEGPQQVEDRDPEEEAPAGLAERELAVGGGTCGGRRPPRGRGRRRSGRPCWR